MTYTPKLLCQKKVIFLWQSHKTTRRCSAKVSAEMKAYQPIPIIAEFTNEDGSDNLKETIEANYRKVKQEILALVDLEIERIRKTPSFVHLLKQYQHEMLDITITKQDKEYGFLFASITYLDYS